MGPPPPSPDSLTVSEFLTQTWDDLSSPTTSSFVDLMPQCRSTVSSLEETLDFDRSGLNKTKKSIKALYNSGSMHFTNEMYMIENLEKLGENAKTKEAESEIGAAFTQFAKVTRELTLLMKTLMQHLHNIVMFPLDSFLKGDLRGVKGDMKKPFDKAWKDYFAKFQKIEKEKKALAREYGGIRTDVSGPEIAEEMEKERRILQLQMCEYLIKVNEIQTKKGTEFIQHLVEYYQAQCNYFQSGVQLLTEQNAYIDELGGSLNKVKHSHDQERRKLLELSDAIKGSLSNYKENKDASGGYNLHQLQGNKKYGYEKVGYLLKKSEGMVRKAWLRRKILVKNGIMNISRADVNKEPVKLNLLTCQVKLVPDDAGKKCFDLISGSQNRTYHFQADDTKEMEAWISVLNNAKEAVLLKAFGDSCDDDNNHISLTVKELTRSIILEIRRIPGNLYCCDCGASDPEWMSTNLGILLCLECCGIHRELGVHISRTQSMVIDDLGTSQLLLARMIGNKSFNDIMEATLDPKLKPKPSNEITQERKDFIQNKYVRHRYAYKMCTNSDELQQDLKQAILSMDICALLQVFAEDALLMCNLPDVESNESALHLAIEQDVDGSSLHIVDFILQNAQGNSLDRVDRHGNTVLHVCARYNRTECMKLVLRSRPQLVPLENANGQTAADISRENNSEICLELLKHASEKRTAIFNHVNIDWNLIEEDHIYDPVDMSDEELDDRGVTPERKTRSRPSSIVGLIDVGSITPDVKMSPSPQHTTPAAAAAALRNQKPLTPSSSTPPCSFLPNAPPSGGGGGNFVIKKKPAPPPPPPRVRTISNSSTLQNEQLKTHRRTPSEPPKLPPKTLPAGAKLVLPVGVNEARVHRRSPSGGDFVTAFRKHHPIKHSLSVDNRLSLSNGQSRSMDCLNSSTDSSSTDCKPTPAPRQKFTDDYETLFHRPKPVYFKKRLGSTTATSLPRRRCKALYPCIAGSSDELSFQEGEIINVVKADGEEWWEGEVEGHPDRRGLFPVTYVHILTDL
ncbi:arf-GAP with SH3 domain, ANK repeat and PH domain-containing protein 1-like isoform X2 [Tubulanus polymorphus]|uniref:arf-GAP with SH3 domain, ANK repeat and PH domain-containing protein 1-like isoform X2 n=1 Tax=Tubulanus polymorphus TaxID=672921 RepID=UPI003DA67042